MMLWRCNGQSWGPFQGHGRSFITCSHQDACHHHSGYGSALLGLVDAVLYGAMICNRRQQVYIEKQGIT